MNNKYLGFAEGEITVYCGDDARANVISSLRQAVQISKSARKGNILYINTVFTTRRLLEVARRELAYTHAEKLIGSMPQGIYFQSTIIGDLCKNLSDIREIVTLHEVKHIIVNSWDFANRSYSYKEKALFGLLQLADEFGVSVLIYSQARMNGAVRGEMHRGGLGKLAVIADDIISLNLELDESEIIEESIILSPMKINQLEYAQGEMSISENSDLENLELEEVLEEEMEFEM